MKKRSEKGRALFYTRDSGGKHETTPSEYVRWAQRRAEELGLRFEGTPEAIEAMIWDGRSARGDLFLDFGVQGNILSRPGLDALIKTALNDVNVSHVMIPRRNRLARPQDPIDGIALENSLRNQGMTLVFMDKVLAPRKRGARPDVTETIAATIDYDRSAEDRRELAQKVLYCQLRLAKEGFSTGGRPPYGFRRWLIKEDGMRIRELTEGEHVRMRGHHVVWLPGPESEWVVIRRILEMLEHLTASRVAKILTSEGVPTPDHKRYRTDNGVRHRTSGVWHQTTIVNIARNPLLLAVVEYGRRSMGDQLRWTPEGPRELTDADFRIENDKPKVIRNPVEQRIVAPTIFSAPVDPERHRRLLAKLDQRGGTQRGKPRSRDPNKNPLGGRLFDITCGWPMYRIPYGDGFRYRCGLYHQSGGDRCNHNHVDGLTAARFLLSCVRQRVLLPGRLEKLEQRIRQLAAADQCDNRRAQEILCKRAALCEAEAELQQVAENLARAKTDEQYRAISTVFDQLSEQIKSLRTQISAAEGEIDTANGADSAITVAMAIIDQLTGLANKADELGAARHLFDLLNARLFLGFHQVKVKRRTLNKLCGGTLTFGNAPPPIEVYKGRTSRQKIKGPAATEVAGPGKGNSPSPPECCIGSGLEDKSLRNVSRGDTI